MAQRGDVIGTARFGIMTNKIRCHDCARLEVLIFNLPFFFFCLSPSTPAVSPAPTPPQPVTATLWVQPARRATRPQASAPARMASLASPATAAPKVTSRAAPPSPPASVSHKHTQKSMRVAGLKPYWCRDVPLLLFCSPSTAPCGQHRWLINVMQVCVWIVKSASRLAHTAEDNVPVHCVLGHVHTHSPTKQSFQPALGHFLCSHMLPC